MNDNKLDITRLLHAISIALSKPIALYIVIALSLLLRIDYEITYADIDNDKLGQIAAAKSFINNTGLSICSLDYYNQEILGNFLTDFPPGYSLCIIPFYAITHDYITATIVLDILAILLLYLVISKLLLKFRVSRIRQILIFVFLGISYTPFFHLTSTDLLSLTIFQWALYFSLQFLENQKKMLLYSIITGILLFLTGFFRYSYYPLLFLIPASIFILGYIHKNKKQLQFSVLSGIIAGVLLGIQMIVIKMQSGLMARDLSDTGIFIKNLLQYDEFPFKAFIFYEGLDVFIKHNAIISGLFTIGTLLFSVFLIYQIIKFYSKKIEQIPIVNNYMFINIVVVIGNVLFLSYMSLTQKPLDWQNPPWTYVEETRYYSQAMLFFEIIVISGILMQSYTNKISRNIYAIFIIAVFGFAFLYWSNNSYNTYIKKDNQYTFSGKNKDLLQVAKLIESHPNNTYTVFSCPNGYMTNFIYISTEIDAVSVHTQNLLLDSVVSTKQPITFYILKPHSFTLPHTNIKATKIAEFKEFDLYTREIQ